MARVPVILAVLFGGFVVAAAQPDPHSLGPRVGEQVPDFSGVDQAGVVRTLPSVMGPDGAMLVFYRSADW